MPNVYFFLLLLLGCLFSCKSYHILVHNLWKRNLVSECPFFVPCLILCSLFFANKELKERVVFSFYCCLSLMSAPSSAFFRGIFFLTKFGHWFYCKVVVSSCWPTRGHRGRRLPLEFPSQLDIVCCSGANGLFRPRRPRALRPAYTAQLLSHVHASTQSKQPVNRTRIIKASRL